MYNKLKITAIVPAFNEEKNIRKVVEQTAPYVDEVIVVDDGSKDKTGAIAKESGAVVATHIVNMGLGFTLATGAELAIKRGADVIVTIDGDGQHDPTEITHLVKTLVDEKLDIVIGARKFDTNMPFYKKLGNTTIYTMQHLLFNSEVKDTQSGFRAFRSEVWPKLKWTSNRYAVSSEIVKNIGVNRLKFKEVEVKTIYNDDYKGTSIFDGARIVTTMISWKLKG